MKAHVGHFELPISNPERAAEFFREAFGWTAETVPWEGPTYVKLRSDSAPAGALQGGLLADAAFAHPLPVLHLTEGNLEDCLTRVEAAGGTITEPPRAIDGFGRFARFRDPEGHHWGVWTSAG